ncbi:hypothetical protein HY78_18885 [Rhizorhabdus wittichii DC-6]|nr:hypothetical protein HY78_18885 [Rhizorhabdus wittichii DC-6]
MAHPIAKFDQPGDFTAMYAAERACRDAGFSIGASQRGAPRGLLFGDFIISKWRNMTQRQRLDLHAEMVGGRDGPVAVALRDDAPPPAVAAFYRVIAASEALRGIEA